MITRLYISLRLFFPLLVLGSCTLLPSCKKLVDVKPPVTSTNEDNAYANDASAIAVLTGIYTNLAGQMTNGLPSLSFKGGLSADELTLYAGSNDPTLINYYKNSLNNGIDDYWGNGYFAVYTANAAIEGLNKSTTLTPHVKEQLLGEAYFVRALYYFYLVNLYGELPLPLTTDYAINNQLEKTPVPDIYTQIIADLGNAQTLLSDSFLDGNLLPTPGSGRVRPTKWAASSLLARVYLYAANWQGAETTATAVINHTDLFGIVPVLSDVFLAGSQEGIWQLQPVRANENTPDARLFVLPPTGPSNFNNPVFLSQSLLDAFEAGDQRRLQWVDSVDVGAETFRFAYKYKVATSGAPVTEYRMALRLAEQYLIRAEARAKQGDATGAQQDLNVIRNRAGLTDYSGQTDEASLVEAISRERRVELFTEWGDRWLNLKRTSTVNTVMGPETVSKGGVWNANWQWYPIPLNDIQTSGIQQNPGYN